MKPDPATIIVIEVGAVAVLLLMPVIIIPARLGAIWRVDRRTALVLAGVVTLTALFFLVFAAWVIGNAIWGA